MLMKEIEVIHKAGGRYFFSTNDTAEGNYLGEYVGYRGFN